MRILIIGKGNMGKCLTEFFSNKYVVDNIDTINFPKISQTYDYIIDFSHPDSLKKYKYLLKDNTKVIIGTTNYSEGDKDYILFLSKMNPIVIDSNFSSGIDFIKRLLSVINETNYEIEINETHHLGKIDSPSGTTKDFVEILSKKNPKVISSRLDGARGTHEIVLRDNFETLKITHITENRNLFCEGVEKAINFLKDKESGLYTYKDVIDARY